MLLRNAYLAKPVYPELNPDTGMDNAGLWTLPAGITVSGSKMNINTTATGTATVPCTAFVIGATYRVTYVISGWTVGRIRLNAGGVGAALNGANGTFTATFVPTVAGTTVGVQAFDAVTQLSVDDFSVKRIS